jgi:hypothetical protein
MEPSDSSLLATRHGPLGGVYLAGFVSHGGRVRFRVGVLELGRLRPRG